jgi:hypothetical protein
MSSLSKIRKKHRRKDLGSFIGEDAKKCRNRVGALDQFDELIEVLRLVDWALVDG